MGQRFRVFCFENCTAEGRGGEKGGSANFNTKHAEPLVPEYPAQVQVIKPLSFIFGAAIQRNLGPFIYVVWGSYQRVSTINSAKSGGGRTAGRARDQTDKVSIH